MLIADPALRAHSDCKTLQSTKHLKCWSIWCACTVVVDLGSVARCRRFVGGDFKDGRRWPHQMGPITTPDICYTFHRFRNMLQVQYIAIGANTSENFRACLPLLFTGICQFCRSRELWSSDQVARGVLPPDLNAKILSPIKSSLFLHLHEQRKFCVFSFQGQIRIHYCLSERANHSTRNVAVKL